MSLFAITTACHVAKRTSRHYPCGGGSGYSSYDSCDEKPIFPPKGQTRDRIRFVIGAFLMLATFAAPFAGIFVITLLGSLPPLLGSIIATILTFAIISSIVTVPLLSIIKLRLEISKET